MGTRRMLLASALMLAVAILDGCVSPNARSTGTASDIETILSSEERLAIFDTVWQTVNEGFYDSSFGGMDWTAIGERYRRKLRRIDDDERFWVEIVNPMLFELGASHMACLPPGMANVLESMTFSQGTVGMDVRYLDGRIVVVSVSEGSPAAAARITPGCVLETIDGMTLEQMQIGGLTPPPYNDRNARAAAANAFRSRLYGNIGEEVTVGYRDAEDRPATVTLRRVPRAESECMAFDPSLPPACAEVHTDMIGADIGYIRFTGFVPSILEPVLTAIDEFADLPSLIVDIRGNPGGVFPVRQAIASKLVGTRKPFIIYHERDGVRFTYLDQVPDAYRGELVILVDEMSASSSEEFSGSLQAIGRATIIGSQTPGSCLTGEIVPLPHGAVLIYPNSEPTTPAGRVLENNGVAPDIEVALSRDGILNGVDAQLDAAVAYLRR